MKRFPGFDHDVRTASIVVRAKEAIAEFRGAIWLESDATDAHRNLGPALQERGKSAEAVAEFRKARENAQAGSEFAQLIDRELAASDRQVDRGDR